MSKRAKVILILCLIFTAGLIIRVVGLESYPKGFLRDEVYLGYNAYSLMQTSKDINGNSFPLFLESFLHTPAGYAYFSIPFIKFLGLSATSIRLPSALFGAMTIPIVFFLTLKFIDLEKLHLRKYKISIGIVASFLLAVIPWHIQLSRTASVATLVVFFITLGLYLSLKWIAEKRIKFLVASYISYLLSLLFYVAPFTFLPFLIPIFLISYNNRLLRSSKLLFIIGFLLLLIPILVVITSPTLSTRVQALNIAKSTSVPLIITESIHRDGTFNIPPIITRAFHNKVTVTANIFVNNYFDHLSFDFLFLDNAYPERYKIPGVGLIYSSLLIIILLGIFVLFKENWGGKWLLIGWILVSPIGSSFASDDIPNMQRILFMLPPIIIISSLGFIRAYSYLFKLRLVLLFWFFCLIFSYQIILFFHQYTFHFNSYRPWLRQEGYKEMIMVAGDNSRFRRVVVTNRESAPTLFLLFYTYFNPSDFQYIVNTSALKDTDRLSFSKYTITEEECPVDLVIDPISGSMVLRGEKGVLYVNSGLCKVDNYPPNVEILNRILRSDGSVVFYILRVK